MSPIVEPYLTQMPIFHQTLYMELINKRGGIFNLTPLDITYALRDVHKPARISKVIKALTLKNYPLSWVITGLDLAEKLYKGASFYEVISTRVIDSKDFDKAIALCGLLNSKALKR